MIRLVKTENSKIVPRLRELSNAVASGAKSELTMRVPAQPNRDADIVLSSAADRIEKLEVIESLLQQTIEMNGDEYFWKHLSRMPITKFNGPLRKALKPTEDGE